MTTIILLLGIFISIGLLFAARKKIFNTSKQKVMKKDRWGDNIGEVEEEITKFSFPALLPSIIFFILTIIAASVQPFRIERINAGSVGIQVKLAGGQRGVTDYSYKTGWVVYNKWTTQIVEIPTTIQHIEYKDQAVTTKGGFLTTINPTFNYSVKSETAGDMFVNLRMSLKELEQGWIKTAIVGAANDVSNKWTIDSVFNNLGLFELTIKAECNKRLDRWFSIDQLRINVVPPDALVKSINEKTKAIQDVQVAENRKRVAIAEGETRVATARADSTVAMINATTDAAVIRTKQQQLTSLYIEWIKVSKWDGKLPTTVLGNSNGVMLNLGN